MLLVAVLTSCGLTGIPVAATDATGTAALPGQTVDCPRGPPTSSRVQTMSPFFGSYPAIEMTAQSSQCDVGCDGGGILTGKLAIIEQDGTMTLTTGFGVWVFVEG